MNTAEYYLVCENSGQLLDLNCQLADRYEGPLLVSEHGPSFLREEYLALLISRFCGRNGIENIRVFTFHMLDSAWAKGEISEDLVEVGGERDFDLPLIKYLPEIAGLKIQDITIPADQLRSVLEQK